MRVNALTPDNFREPINEGVLIDMSHDEDKYRFQFRKTVTAGHEVRDQLLQGLVNYGLMLVSGEGTVKSIVTPLRPSKPNETTAAIQIGINDAATAASIDFSATTLKPTQTDPTTGTEQPE